MAAKPQAPELDIDEKTVSSFISWFKALQQVRTGIHKCVILLLYVLHATERAACCSVSLQIGVALQS